MSEHPIEGLMITAMNSIKDMVDVDTIIGNPIQASNNTTIIPISKVCFGFAAGGSEFRGETINEYSKKDKEEAIQYRLPFGGGSGAGVNVNPVAFLVIQSNNVKLLPINHSSCIDKVLDYIPDIIEKTNCIINKKIQKEEKNDCKKEERISSKEIKKETEPKKTNIKISAEEAKFTKKPPKRPEPIPYEIDNSQEEYEVEYIEKEPGEVTYEEFDKYDD